MPPFRARNGGMTGLLAFLTMIVASDSVGHKAFGFASNLACCSLAKTFLAGIDRPVRRK
jgi:hypothetical protein